MTKLLTAWKPKKTTATLSEIFLQQKDMKLSSKLEVWISRLFHTPQRWVIWWRETGHHSPTRYNHKTLQPCTKKVTSLKEWSRCLHLCNTTTMKVSPFKFKIHCSDIFSTSKRKQPLICTSTGVPWVLYHFSEHLYHNWRIQKVSYGNPSVIDYVQCLSQER